MVYNNTFIPQARETKQIYFAHSLCLGNKKCTGVQNCNALKNSGFTPPAYYLKSTSTDTLDWDEKEISKNVTHYYKTKGRKMKINKRKRDKLKNKELKENAEENDVNADENINFPKNVYVYKRKHLVQEITIPRRIKTSVANLIYRSRKKKLANVTPGKKDKLKINITKKHPNTCKCSKDKGKKKKVEFAKLPRPDIHNKQLVKDHKIPDTVCKCKPSKKNVKTSKLIKCLCKGDTIDDLYEKNLKYDNMASPGTDKKYLVLDERLPGALCKCKIPKKNAKKSKLIKCVCKGDNIDDSDQEKGEILNMLGPETNDKQIVMDLRLPDKHCKCKLTRKNAKTSKSIKCLCKGDTTDDVKQKAKRQKKKHKRSKEKDKIESYYHEIMKKVQFQDLAPVENVDGDELLDKYGSNMKNESFLDERCSGGTCAKAAKQKNYEFVCKCVERKKKPQATECMNAVCNITSTSTVAKIRRKIILLCNKYSKILKEKKIIPYEEKYIDKQICDVGLCRTAFDNKKENFTCKCVKKAKECTDESCYSESKWKLYLKTCYDLLMKHHKDRKNDKITGKQNATDQTGEPFFELKVDSVGLWALNPQEVRTKVEELGKSQQRIKCICPSHKREHINFLQKAACSAGICEKKYKNKKTNFKCVCVDNQSRICDDSTCEPGKKNIPWSMNNNEPLLNVTFSAKDMSILNMEEVREKIDDMKTKMRGVCSSGVCREAAKGKLKYICKCSQKKLSPEIGECGDATCRSRSKWGKSVKTKISCIRSHMSDVMVRNKSRNKRSKCEEHCSGDPATCTCCKCMKNKYNNHTRRITQVKRKNNVHKRKGFSIPSIVPSNNENNNSFLKYKHMLTSSYSALLKRVESPRHKFKRNGLNIPLKSRETNKPGSKQVKIKNDGCICCPDGKHRQVCECWLPSKMFDSKYNLSQSVSAIKNIFQKHKGIATPPGPKQKVVLQTKDKTVDKHKKVRDKICMCYHTCECGLVKDKDKLKKKKMSKKQYSLGRRQRIQQMRNKRRKETQKSKSRTHDTIRRRKEYLKEQKQFRKELKKKEKAEKKNKEKLLKIEKAELEAISKGREAEDTSCFADFCLGILKLCLFILKGLITVLFKAIFDPKGSYTYMRLKLMDPVGTFERIMKYICDAWRLKKLQMLRSISGSEKMTILSDTLQDTAIFQAFADKGKTPKEKRMIAQKNKQRRIRMEQRNTQAFRSCKHNLLHTLRKTPCLWVYHICPFFYPQCLGLLALMKQITEILLFMLAFIVWTPCIACCETCRAFCCCVLCTN